MRVIRRKLLVHPPEIENAVYLFNQMIWRHHLVEIKRIKELTLSTLASPHHGPLPRITTSFDGITVRASPQREFCNRIRAKADTDRVAVTNRDFVSTRPSVRPCRRRRRWSRFVLRQSAVRRFEARKSRSPDRPAGATRPCRPTPRFHGRPSRAGDRRPR